MDILSRIVVDLLFGNIEKKVRNVDKEKYPKTHMFIFLLNFISILVALIFVGYFLFFLVMFSGYNGG